MSSYLFLTSTGLHAPPSNTRAGECQELEPLISRKHVSVLPRHRKDWECALWQITALQNLSQYKGRQGCPAAGFQHKGASHSNGWRDLVCHQVEREIPWANHWNWANWELPYDSLSFINNQSTINDLFCRPRHGFIYEACSNKFEVAIKVRSPLWNFPLPLDVKWHSSIVHPELVFTTR